MPIFIKDAAATVVVYLEQPGCTALTGVVYTDIDVALRKEGGSFTTKVLTVSDWTEVGFGYYELALSASDTDTAGSLLIRVARVAGPTFNTNVVSNTVITYVVPPSPVVIPVPQVIIYGYLYNVFGSPVANASVQATVLGIPTIMHPGTEGLAVTNELLVETSDSSGYWTLSLIPGSQVEITIPSTGYRRSITVPATSTNLFDIP